MRIHRAQNTGSVLLPLIIVLPFLMLIAGSYVSLTTTNFRLARSDQLHTHAQLGADAGADYGVEQINQDGNWAGTVGEIELINSADNRVTYEVSIADAGDQKILTSTGRSYRPANATIPNSSVTIKVDLRPVQSGEYSIISGNGGLIMSNSAKVTGGDVFINGEINIKNSAQIGLSTNPVNVEVANQVCPIPANSSYPQLCNSGENNNPITINNTAHIYGDVKANHQSSSAGMSNPGLTASSGVTPAPLPTYDRDSQKAAVSTTITGASAGCSSGTKSWAANTKITGDVTVSGNCEVSVQGNIWITGELDVKNSAKLKVADSLGTTKPVVMIDSQNGAEFSNSAELVSNASSTGFQVISFWSTAGCSPDCTDVTGADLYNSRNSITIQIDNTAAGPQTIFYSRWTRVLVKNSGQIGALVGQTIELKNSGIITFGSSTGTGNTSWVISGYRRAF